MVPWVTQPLVGVANRLPALPGRFWAIAAATVDQSNIKKHFRSDSGIVSCFLKVPQVATSATSFDPNGVNLSSSNQDQFLFQQLQRLCRQTRGGEGAGGAIAMSGKASVTGSQFTSNTASGGTAGNCTWAGEAASRTSGGVGGNASGGAISTTGSPSVFGTGSVKVSTFSGNVASGGTGCGFDGVGGNATGGAVSVQGGFIKDSTITNN